MNLEGTTPPSDPDDALFEPDDTGSPDLDEEPPDILFEGAGEDEEDDEDEDE
jgi:hypothetical protein